MDFKHHPSCHEVDGSCARGKPAWRCEVYSDGYQAGLSEGEARATRAIIAWLEDQEVCNYEGVDDYRDILDRLRAGQHLAAKAEGEK